MKVSHYENDEKERKPILQNEKEINLPVLYNIGGKFDPKSDCKGESGQGVKKEGDVENHVQRNLALELKMLKNRIFPHGDGDESEKVKDPNVKGKGLKLGHGEIIEKKQKQKNHGTKSLLAKELEKYYRYYLDVNTDLCEKKEQIPLEKNIQENNKGGEMPKANLSKSKTEISEQSSKESFSEEPKSQVEGKSDSKVSYIEYLNKINGPSKQYLYEPFFILGEKLKTKIDKDEISIKSIALSPNQRYLAAGLNAKIDGKKNNKIQIFDIFTKDVIDHSCGGKTIFSLCFSPDGKEIVAGYSGGQFEVIFVGNGEEKEGPNKKSWVRNIDKEKEFAIRVVKFSFDGQKIFVGCDDGLLRCYNNSPQDEDEIPIPVIEHREGVCALAYSRAAKKYASGGNDKILNIFTLNKDYRREENTIVKKEHTGIVRSVVFSNDGTYVLSGSYDRTAKLYDSKKGNLLITFEGALEQVISVSISPDHKYVLTGSRDDSAYLYDLQTGILQAKYQLNDNDNSKGNEQKDIECVQFFRSGSVLITTGKSSLINFFSIKDNPFIRSHSKHQENGQCVDINSIDLSEKIFTLATGGNDGCVKFYDIVNGLEIRSISVHEGAVNSVKFNIDGSLLFSGGEDWTLKIIEVSSGIIMKSYKNHKEGINSIKVSEDGLNFASCSVDKSLKVYNCYSFDQIADLPKNYEIANAQLYDFIFVANDSTLIIAIGTSDDDVNSIDIFNLKTQEKISKTITNIDQNISYYSKIIYLFDDLYAYNTENCIYFFKFTGFSIISSSFTHSFKLERNTLRYLCALPFKKYSDEKYFSLMFVSEKGEEEANSNDSKEAPIINRLDIEKDKLDLNNKNVIEYDLEKENSIFKNNNIIQASGLSSNFLNFDSIIIYGTYEGVPKIIDVSSEQTNETTFSKSFKEIEALTLLDTCMECVLKEKTGEIKILNTFSGNVEKSEKNLTCNKDCLKSLNFFDFSPVAPRYLVFLGSNSKIQIFASDNQEWLIEIQLNNKNSSKECTLSLLECFRFNNSLEILYVTKTRKYNLFCKSIELKDNFYETTFPNKIEFADDDSIYSFESPIIATSMTKRRKKNNLNIVYYICCKDGCLYSKTKKAVVSTLKTKCVSFFKKIFKIKPKLGKKLQPDIILKKLRQSLTCAKFNKNKENLKLISGGSDNTVRVFELNSEKEKKFHEHTSLIVSVDFLSQESFAISGSEGGELIVFEIETGSVIFSFKSDSKIIEVCSYKIIDSVVVGTETGIMILDRVLNSRNKIETFVKLQKEGAEESDIKIQKYIKENCFDIVPFFPDFSFLSVILEMVAFSSNNKDVSNDPNQILKKSRILKDVVDILKANKTTPRIKRFLAYSIFKPDSYFAKSAWDIWFDSIKDQYFAKAGDLRRSHLENLIKIMNIPDIEGVQHINKKYEFFDSVAKEFPNEMRNVLDAFWGSPTIITLKIYRMTTWTAFKYYTHKTLRIITNKWLQNKKKNKSNFPLVFECKNPATSRRIIEKIYERRCERLHGRSSEDEQDSKKKSDAYANCELRVSEISLGEVINLNKVEKKLSLSIFRNFTPDDSVFLSELLDVVVEYFWRDDSIIGVKYF